MEIKSINKLIDYSQCISEILSNTFIFEAEVDSLIKQRKYVLTKGLRKIIKQNYKEIRDIQLKTIETPIYDNDNESLFYKNFILSITNRKNETLNLPPYFFSILHEKLHANIITDFIFSKNQNQENKLADFLKNNYENVIEISINTELKTDNEIKNSIISSSNFSYLEYDEINIYNIIKTVDFILEAVENGKTLILSNNKKNSFIYIVITCFLIKKRVVNFKNSINFINYLCSLSLTNEKEILFDSNDIDLIDEYYNRIINY